MCLPKKARVCNRDRRRRVWGGGGRPRMFLDLYMFGLRLWLIFLRKFLVGAFCWRRKGEERFPGVLREGLW